LPVAITIGESEHIELTESGGMPCEASNIQKEVSGSWPSGLYRWPAGCLLYTFDRKLSRLEGATPIAIR